MTLENLAARIHDTAVDKGFWPSPPETRNFGEQIALIHAEASEALEAHRDGKPDLYFAGPNGVEYQQFLLDTFKPEGALAELADVVIRALDSMNAMNTTEYTIDEIIEAKMAYNATRPYKHGKSY